MKKAVVAAVVVLVVLVVAGGFWGKRKYDSILAATSQGLSFGRAYGKVTVQSNCMLGLKIKYASCDTVECELSANAYIAGCMKTAERDGFCSDVPHIKDADRAQGWASRTCSEQGLGAGKCLEYIHQYVNACTEQAEGKALSKKELFESGVERGLKGK